MNDGHGHLPLIAPISQCTKGRVVRMKAMVMKGVGGPEVLTLLDVPMPEPRAHEVRVRISSTAVNRADLLQLHGNYPAPPDAPPDILGLEFAGTVDALGSDVRAWCVDDRVFGIAGGGTYAEFMVTHERMLARVPDNLSLDVAGAMPEAFITAHDALVSQAHLLEGETVLVHAVASGVGTAAIQIARAIGAASIGTTRSSSKSEKVGDGTLVVSDGTFADRVIERTNGNEIGRAHV